MSEAKSIEDMKAELKANDYVFYQDTNFIRHPAYVESPDGWQYYAAEPSSHWLDGDVFETEQLADMVTKAHAHYQRENRYAELEAGMEKLQARLAKVERELDSLRGDGK